MKDLKDFFAGARKKFRLPAEELKQVMMGVPRMKSWAADSLEGYAKNAIEGYQQWAEGTPWGGAVASVRDSITQRSPMPAVQYGGELLERGKQGIGSAADLPRDPKTGRVSGVLPPAATMIGVDAIKPVAGGISNIMREGQRPIREGNDSLFQDTVARERFNIPNLKRVAAGSDRVVYDIGEGKVLKIAKTARGLSQNNFSADYYAEGEGLIPKTYEVGKNYIVKQRVMPPDQNTKQMVKELSELSFSRLNAAYFDNIKKAAEIINKHGGAGDVLMNYDALWGDLQRVRNWGTIDGKPVLLDEGTLNGGLVKEAIERAQKGITNLKDPVFREIYYASREAKKLFGDIDGATMYGFIPFMAPLIRKLTGKDK